MPKEIRERAYNALKHYPADYHINYAADGAPKHFDHLEEEANIFAAVEAASARIAKKKTKKGSK